MGTLEERLARLEAESDVRRLLHRYVHAVDLGSVDTLLDLFDQDAVIDAMNFPPGSGRDLHLTGHDGVRSLFGALKPASYRHHSANASIVVAEDAHSAQLSSYFLTTVEWGIQGGLYEGSARRSDAGAWTFNRWRVSSQWGWRIPDQAAPELRNTLAEGTLLDGFPP